jgi:hypothetical protein
MISKRPKYFARTAKDFFPLIGGGCNNGALQKQGFISLSSGELSHVD